MIYPTRNYRTEETEEQYRIIFDVPSMTKDDFEIETKHRLLYVYVPKQELTLTVTDLPIGVDISNGRAVCKNGQLIVTFNFKDTHQARKIEIE
jgi:HSP20 family molecular chaperone IbpA